MIGQEKLTSLVDVAKTYAVGERVVGDAWKAFVRLCHEVQEHGNSVTEAIEQAEREYKESTGATSMPNPWRSAKSIILKAIDNSIPLLEVDPTTGEEKLIGKTKAQKKIKSLDEKVEAIIKGIRELGVSDLPTWKGIETQIVNAMNDITADLTKF